MIRRRLIIEWNDDGADMNEECAKDFLSGAWTIEDLVELNGVAAGQAGTTYATDLKVWVEDANAENVRQVIASHDAFHAGYAKGYGNGSRDRNRLV